MSSEPFANCSPNYIANFTDALARDCETCRHSDIERLYQLIANVYLAGPLCLLGFVGNCLAFKALNLDRRLGYSASFLLRAMAVSDNVYLLACLLTQVVFVCVLHLKFVFELKHAQSLCTVLSSCFEISYSKRDVRTCTGKDGALLPQGA